jgi:hypothetical protein|tara:strand:- start:188 stop:556 length:369 start_codon:yes stop_codon:yes gene_type:complete
MYKIQNITIKNIKILIPKSMKVLFIIIFNTNKEIMNAITDKLLYSKEGNILVCVILGFGLAMIFKPACKNCIRYVSPNIHNENGKMYKLNGICYKNKTIPEKCNGTELPNYEPFSVLGKAKN